MKRKITKRRSGPRAYDIRKELSQEQLAAFGAVALAWNDVEAMIDVLMCVVSGLHHSLWREFTTHINGIEGKFSIIKESMAKRYGWGKDLQVVIDFEATINDAAQYRHYRDTIIHSRIVDPTHGIGEMTIRRGRIEEILLTADALNTLYDKLFILRDELMELVSFFEIMEDWRARTPEGTLISQLAVQNFHARLAAMAEGKYGAIGPEPPNVEAIAQELVSASSRYNHHRKARQSLPPLPSFPNLLPIPPGLGVPQPTLITGPQEPPQEADPSAGARS
jgi:hypothetical protein